MFEYTKQILLKVSFDKNLFSKELRKAMQWLQGKEKKSLKLWCLATFGEAYGDVISESFKKIH